MNLPLPSLLPVAWARFGFVAALALLLGGCAVLSGLPITLVFLAALVCGLWLVRGRRRR